MKRILACVLAVAMLITTLCSCGSEKEKSSEILLATSFYPVYIFTLNLVNGIDGISVECMAEQNTGCLHDYQILSKDARLISDAAAFIINGAGMEEFLEDVYSSEEELKVIDSSVGIELLESCDEHHKEGEHHHHAANSHIWMSVKNAIKQTENIANGLIALYPQFSVQIEKNKTEYVNRLKELDSLLAQKTAALKGENIITFHEAYDYLARDYSLNVIAKVESHEGGEPSAKKLAELTTLIKSKNVRLLFVEQSYKGSAATILSNETDVKICTLNPVTEGVGELTAYEAIMLENIEVILKAVS